MCIRVHFQKCITSEELSFVTAQCFHAFSSSLLSCVLHIGVLLNLPPYVIEVTSLNSIWREVCKGPSVC